LAVRYVISSSLAISKMVRYSPFNFMYQLSVNVSQSINLLNVRIEEFAKKMEIIVFFRYISIDNNVSWRYIY
jgi:hypothetical protein